MFRKGSFFEGLSPPSPFLAASQDEDQVAESGSHLRGGVAAGGGVCRTALS